MKALTGSFLPLAAGIVGLTVFGAASPANAQALFRNEVVLSDFDLPTNIEFLPDGSMLIGELVGTIQIAAPGASQVAPVPFLTLTNIGDAPQGLMDIELDPDFATNGHYYVFYTRGSPNRDRVSRFTAVGSTTNPATEFVLYQDDRDAGTEHHGGALAFGPDGKLYVTTGEHFGSEDSQSLSNPRGKVLRLNKDGTIPTDNPFYDGAGPNRDEVWALGLRNPFRASFDSVTGRYFIADVGGNDFSTAREEVNLGVAGANYGWPLCEGTCGIAGVTSPIFSYPHLGRDASITGGFVYRGTQFPAEYRGSYFYADYTQNWIRRLTFDANGNVTGSLFFEPEDGSLDGPYGDIVHVTQGPEGSLYYVDLGFSDTTGESGISKIRRISYVAPGNQPPVVSVSASPTSGPPPLAVAFMSTGTADPEEQPLTYLWDFGDGTTATGADVSHTYAAAGHYSATLTASDGELSTTSTPISITVGAPPQVEISFPSTGSTFRAGEEVFFGATATDAEDGTLPAGAFTWNIDFRHATHVHPGLPVVGVTQGSFVVPTTGHDYAGDTRYEIRLTVTDSDGLESTVSVLVYPAKVNLTFATVPSGLTLKLDGISRTTPFVHDSLIGFTHSVEAANQTQGGTTYTFAGWSDGGAQAHTITVPASDQNLTASFSGSTTPAPLTFARSGGTFSDSSATTLSVPLTGVQAGSLIVAYVKWEGVTAATVTLSDGTSTFTADTMNNAANGDLHGQFFYLLSSSRSGNVTYTATWSIGRPYRKLMIYEYTFGGGTVSLDASNRATATSGTLSSGAITTTGTDEVVFGAYGEYDGSTTNTERINGVVADRVLRAGPASMWSKTFTAPFTGAATASGNSSTWVGNVIAFKRSGGAANTPPTISNLADRSTAEDTGTGPVAFTVGDTETAVGSLTVSGVSSDQSVVANGGIAFGGTGANRTVSVTPVANASGTATITVTVSDGSLTANDTFVLTVTAVNDPPTIGSVANQTTPAGTAVGPLPFTVGDVETAPGSLTLSASSSDPTLVPVANIVFGGSGANRTVTVTPATGSTGTALITLTVNDGTGTAATSFNVTVTASNTAPTISNITDRSTAEDTGTGAIAFTVGDGETAAGSLTLSGGSSNTALVPVANIAFGGSGANRTVSVTPVANANGTATITVTVSDGSLTASDTFVLTVTAVNDPPTISTVPNQTSAGTAVGPLPFTIGDVETAPGSLTLGGSSSNPALVPAGNIVFGGSGANRTVTVTPAAGATGTATITLTVNDGTDTATSSFTLTVSSTPAAPMVFARSGGAFNDAMGTTLSVQLTNVQAGSLIVAYVKWEGITLPTVTLSDGTSTFTADTLNNGASNDLHGQFYYLLSSNVSGTVTYTATWSIARQYRRLMIYEYSFSGGTVSFDASNRATATSGTLNSGDITTTGTDEVVFGAYGEYSSTPTTAERINGVLADRVQRADDGSMWSKTFTAPFTGAATASGNSSTWIGNVIAFKRSGGAANTPPTISNIADRSTAEDTGTGPVAFTVGDTETAVGSLTVSGVSSDQSVVANGGIVFGGTGANRTVSVTPVANASGTATITVTVSDGSLTASDTFVLTVTAVNDPPTIGSVANQTTPAGTAVGPLPFTVGDVETAPGSLTLSANSSDPTLVPVANIVFGGSGANRTVTVTPATGSTGTALVTLTVNDGTGTAATSFNVTVTASNTAPTISNIADRSTAEDTGTGAIAFTVGDGETAAGSLTLSGASSNQSVVANGGIAFGGSGANRTVSVTPVANANGTATITVTVSDGSLTASDTFVLTVTAVNDPPTIGSIANQTTASGTAVGPLPFTVGDVETAPGSLTLTGSSSNPALVPAGNIVFGGSGANRTVTVTPATGSTGTALITMTVSDGTDTASTSFTLTVTSTPSAPLTFARSGGAFSNGGGTTLSVQLTGVQAGSLIVAYVKWEGAAGTATVSDGTGMFTADAMNNAANGDLHGQFFYRLSSTASGNVTYTATWSASRPYRKLIVYEYTRSGGTVVFDASSRATATSGTLSSGNITTTGTDEVVFGAYGEYASSNTNTERINGVVADRVVRASYASVWSKTFTAPFTGAATASGNSSTWIGSAIAFKRTP